MFMHHQNSCIPFYFALAKPLVPSQLAQLGPAMIVVHVCVEHVTCASDPSQVPNKRLASLGLGDG